MAHEQSDVHAPEVAQSLNEAEKAAGLNDLLAQATAYYAQKDYRTAAELYSRATEQQAQVNGEMSPENADLLYLYGRCLYRVAIEKSDVLGSKVAGEERTSSSKAADDSSVKRNNGTLGQDATPGEAVAHIATGSDKNASSLPKTTENKPYFQFTGDENWDGSDEDEESGPTTEEEAAEDEDDFSTAFEILDLARVLLQKKLQQQDASTQSHAGEYYEGTVDAARRIKEKLADTYDLQAEISLESEQFQNAVNDLRAALSLKLELYPPESSLLAETHFKLSLALEFCSVTQQRDASGEADQDAVAHVDEVMREEAAREMEAAIDSCKLRLEREERTLAADGTHDSQSKSGITRKSIQDVQEMVQDMEQRLSDLRQPSLSIKDPQGTGTVDGSTPLSGILGSILGESPKAQKARLEQAMKEAKDLTGLVKKKKPGAVGLESSIESNLAMPNSKRKVDFADEVEKLGTGKRARVEDGSD